MASNWVSIFTHNWGLKLISLLVASLTFYAIRGVTRHNAGFEVPIVVQVEEEGITVLNQTPTTVYVKFRGSQEDLQQLNPATIRAVVKAKADNPDGSELVPLRPRNIEGAAGVTVVKLDADLVHLTFDREVEKQVPIARPKITGKPLIGEAQVDYEPSVAMVRGPQRAVREIKILNAESIDVEGRGASFTQRVRILPPNEFGQLQIDPEEIRAKVTIFTETLSRQWTNITVLAIADHQVNVAFDPPTVDVFLHGRADVLDSIDVSDIRVFVDCCSGVTYTSEERPVVVHLPAGLDVSVTVEPRTVLVAAKKPPEPGRQSPVPNAETSDNPTTPSAD